MAPAAALALPLAAVETRPVTEAVTYFAFSWMWYFGALLALMLVSLALTELCEPRTPRDRSDLPDRHNSPPGA
jgi:hypothetical protein